MTTDTDTPELDTSCPNCASPADLIDFEALAALPDHYQLTLDCHLCRTRFFPLRGPATAPPPATLRDVWPAGETTS